MRRAFPRARGKWGRYPGATARHGECRASCGVNEQPRDSTDRDGAGEHQAMGKFVMEAGRLCKLSN